VLATKGRQKPPAKRGGTTPLSTETVGPKKGADGSLHKKNSDAKNIYMGGETQEGRLAQQFPLQNEVTGIIKLSIFLSETRAS